MKEAAGDGTGTGKTGGDDTGKKEAGGDGTGTGKTGGDDTGKKEAGSDGTGVTEAGSDGTGKKEAGGDGTGAQTAGGDGTGAQTAGGDSTGTSEPVVDKVPTKEPTIPTLNPKPNARTTAPTAVQLTDKPATAVPTITPRGADPPNTTKLPITPPAVAHPTVVDLSSSGSGASTRPNVFVVSPSVPEIRVTDSSDSKGKPATTMTSSGLTKPGQDTTGSVTHTASSSKDSKGDAVADVTTKTTLAVDPAQATSRTSQPLGGAVTKTAVTGKIVATPGQTATTAPSPTSTSFTTAKKKTFSFSLNEVREKEDEKELAAVCKRLMKDMHAGSCTLTWQQHSDNGKTVFDNVEISGTVKPSLASQYYDELTKKRSDNTTLIAILASCGALLAMIIGLAIYASHHRKPYNENQQHLTEELHTVENGYHDNPTLEVMEVQPEMQEKKMALNGECNDSWIVPIDNLLKEDMADEEDTHL
ncbi:podocalyxin [Centroberyx gerrardi]